MQFDKKEFLPVTPSLRLMPDPLHPHYDEVGVSYDSGFFYSDGLPDNPPVPPSTRKLMASLSPGLSRLNPVQLIALADLVSPQLAPAAPATPPIPNMTTKVAALVTARNTAKASSDAYESAKASLVGLKATRDSDADALRIEHKSLTGALEAETKGDAVLLAQTGYTLTSTSPQPSATPGQILNVVVTAGDNDGSVDVSHDPESNSRTYESQLTTVDPVAGPWVTKGQSTTSNSTIAGLTSGQRVWVRVRGNGTKGPGPWSDPATKIVP